MLIKEEPSKQSDKGNDTDYNQQINPAQITFLTGCFNSSLVDRPFLQLVSPHNIKVRNFPR